MLTQVPLSDIPLETRQISSVRLGNYRKRFQDIFLSKESKKLFPCQPTTHILFRVTSEGFAFFDDPLILVPARELVRMPCIQWRL